MTRQEQIQKIVETVCGLDYGCSLMHHEIEVIIEQKHGTSAYNSVLKSANDRLLALGKMLENIHGIGYRVVNPDDYTIQAIKHVSIGAKQIKKGNTILENAPVKRMSKEGLQAYNSVADHMKILNSFVTGSKIELKMIEGKRKHPLSLEMQNQNQTKMNFDGDINA